MGVKMGGRVTGRQQAAPGVFIQRQVAVQRALQQHQGQSLTVGGLLGGTVHELKCVGID